jgi:hypothetical protein
MAVANGANDSTLKFNKIYSGQTKPQWYTTYVEYTKDANNNVKATTYLLYEKPRSVVQAENPPDAKTTGGAFGNENFYIVAGIVENSKVRAVRNDGTVYLANDGTLKPYTPRPGEEGKYVLSNQERAEMVSTQVGSLNDRTRKNGADVLMKAEPGLSRNKSRETINNGVAPASVAPTGDGQGGAGGKAGNGGAGTGQTPPASPSDPSSTNSEATIKSEELNQLFVENKNAKFFKDLSFGKLEYPLSTVSSGQDVLKIEILEYIKSEVNSNELTIIRPERSKAGDEKQKVRGTIYLGLQASITDQNTVSWTQDSMDAIQMAANSGGLGIISTGDVGAAVGGAFNKFAGSSEKMQASGALLKTLMTKLATNTGNSNLFTRVTGAIVNPNMELLFNAPQLRPFSFTFNMSPRGKKEAEQVKAIIKALKQSSAVQVGVGNLFLKTPFVYKLTYMTMPDGKKDEASLIPHPSLNRIKECALTNISIDYTPSNVYMTYKDAERTMTSYSMQLQFTELDPIYGDDYTTGDVGAVANVGGIGY